MDDELMAQPNRIPRLIGGFLIVEAATFAIASAVHFGIALPLGFATLPSDPFTGAAIPEAIIAGVLLAGAAGVLASPRGAWGLALTTTLFAVAGVIVGLNFVVPDISRRPGDVAYHVAILVALLITVGLLITPAARRAMRRR